MKTKSLILAIALCLGLASAAPAAAQSVKFGIVAGMSLNKLNFNGDGGRFDSENRYGWYIGPKLNIGLPLGFGLDVAAQYSQRRMNLNDDASETFKSIEIPLNVRYNIGLGSVASIYIATGPQFGFNVGHRHWSFSDMQETFSMERMNTSWNVGAGVKVLSHLEVGVAYNIALSKYAKHRFQGEDYSFKANTFQVQLAYLF